MHHTIFGEVRQQLDQIDITLPQGKVVATQGGAISVSGLSGFVKLGDRVDIQRRGAKPIQGEVVQMNNEHAVVLPDGLPNGVSLNSPVRPKPPLKIAPSIDWIGRVLDANGLPLDGEPMDRGIWEVPLDTPPPSAHSRRGLGARLATGSFAMNTMLPLAKGQRIGLFAGSGVGKTSLLGTLAQHIDCDLAVIALVGERGREVKSFVEDVLGPEGMKKSIVVVSTSDRSALERRRCTYTATAIAEYFRDQGKSVLLLVDSITRLAEAHREVASAGGEMPVMRGFPPSLSSVISGLCERAGPGTQNSGDITAIYTVLVQGTDFNEPVSDLLRGILDGHVILDREIAERGRYPAINVLHSISRSLPECATEEENAIIQKTRSLLSLYEQNSVVLKSGLYVSGSNPEIDVAARIWPELESLWERTGDIAPDDCFEKLRLVLRRSGVSLEK